MKNPLLILCALISAPLITLHAAEPAGTLRAGAAAVDITPKEFPLNMPGGFSANPAQSAHDALHARALVLADGATTLAMVVIDNLGAGPEVLDEAKTIAAKETGIPVEKMLISSTHTHTGPPSNGNNGPAAAYHQLLVEGIAESIVKAHAALRPALVGAASSPLPDEVFNRRWYLKPGKMPLNPFGKMDAVKMNPGTSPDVLDRPAGPTDPDLSIISVQDAKRKPLALYANYSLHYVGGMPSGQISADYFGEFARVMPSRLRADESFVAMMSNGTSGDINNIPFGITRPPREPDPAADPAAPVSSPVSPVTTPTVPDSTAIPAASPNPAADAVPASPASPLPSSVPVLPAPPAATPAAPVPAAPPVRPVPPEKSL